MRDKPQEHERMLHIIKAIDKIFDYTKNIEYEEFCKNEMMQDAVMKNFEVIGEAAYHISNDTKRKYDTISWKLVQGFRHILVHDYYKIEIEVLWNTKENHIADLKKEVEEMLKEEYDI